MSDYYWVLPISTRQVSGIPLFLLRSDLFFQTSSSLFACISCTSFLYWAKAQRAWTRAWRSASWPWRVHSPKSRPGAPCRQTPGAPRISTGTSPRHPAEGSNYLSITFYRNLTNQGYSHVPSSIAPPPPPHRFQVARYYRRVDKIVCQKLESTTTTRDGLGHRRRMDRLCILNFW
jgi:hypothetical protein